MALFLAVVGAISLLAVGVLIHSGFGLLHNYLVARRIGVPIRVILFDHVNPLWLVCDRFIVSLVRRLPSKFGNNSFTRYNYRGWEVPDRYYSHRDMGDAYIQVSSRKIWLYIADPAAIIDIWRRGKEFPRDVSVTAILDVFGPNISTAQGTQWQKHRRITASSFNDHNNSIVWSESVIVARDMLQYWISKPAIRTAADNLRSLSLLVMSRAGFGKSFKFQGHDERVIASPKNVSMDYKESLKLILENCVLIFVLGTKFLANPWLPTKLRQLHNACVSFQAYMTDLYEEEKNDIDSGKSADRNFMACLVRSSQAENKESSLGGLTEHEIYGNMFTFNFAGHDTTAHTFTFALYFLAANPGVQEWISEEISHVLGDRLPEQCPYSEFPRFKRCLAVMYETLRLYAPVPTSKFVDSQSPVSLRIGDKTFVLPPKALLVPSYASLQTEPKYWGVDSLQWRPSRFVRPADVTAADSLVFDAEEFITPDRGTFLAWSGGPRDCVGRKFSQVEFVAVMVSLFGGWRVNPVLCENETLAAAQKRLLDQIEYDSAPVLLLQMLHPERSPLVWTKNQ